LKRAKTDRKETKQAINIYLLAVVLPRGNRLSAEEMERTGWVQKKWNEQAGCRRYGANRLD
jgi:hypothetical protein